MRIKTVNSDGTECFHDKEGGIYRRIIAGLGWPLGSTRDGKPGFIVVLAEDLNADYSLHGTPHHIHVLIEFEHDDLGALHRKMSECKAELRFQHLIADRSREYLWNHHNQATGMIPMVDPPRIDRPIDIDFIGELVKKRIAGEKTLHFGEDSALPLYFQSLPPRGPVKEHLEEYPAITALGYALMWIDLRSMPEPFERHRQGPGGPSRLL